MTETTNNQAMQKALFLNLVAMLSATAMQYMGKIINPISGKTETDLAGAQGTIDMIEMLEAKSRGNLDREEERFLKNTLTTLRMNFVETKAAPPAPPVAPPVTPSATEQGKPGEPAQEPRFHKSYG